MDDGDLCDELDEDEDGDDDDCDDEDVPSMSSLLRSTTLGAQSNVDGEQSHVAEDAKVQRKLHLFRTESIQVSIRRLWDMLPLDEDAELRMEGYVELNLRLQKCLTKEFVLEQAVDSAVGDWAEDVHEGQQSMTAEEFAMFLFELCSLWCGPGISLQAYLLFLNAAFVASTEARGAHTVGLRALEAVECLPKAFFDLLALQGSLRNERGSSDEAFNAWYAANLTTEATQQAMLQVQRQVFQVTHDVRSVFLFRDHDGREPDDRDNLQLVRHASQALTKVHRAQPPRNLPPAPRLPDPLALAARGGPSIKDSNSGGALPWWSHTNAREKGPPLAPEGRAHALAAVASSAEGRRNRSAPAPGRPAPRDGALLALARAPAATPSALALRGRPPSASRERPSGPPLPGRAFETRRAQPKGRGLVLAGQAALSSTPPSSTPALSDDSRRVSRCDSAESDYATWKYPPQLSRRPEAAGAAAGPPPLLPAEEGGEGSASASAVLTAWSQRLGGAGGDGSQDAWLEPYDPPRPAHFLEDAQFLQPYKLPKQPRQLYRKQVGPLMAASPTHIVFEAKQYQAAIRLVPEPFERSVRKLPPVFLAEGEPPAGPLAKPQEPVWSEMGSRLQTILRKQSRRAERRRRRKVRAKLQRGRSRQPPKCSEGRELREYLDRCAEEHADGRGSGAPGEMAGEFLGKVHERWLQQRERMEMPRFRITGPPSSGIDRHLYGLGASPRDAARVVRPVYVPPPEGGMVRPVQP